MTTKAAAFAAPMWTYEDDDYQMGINRMTPEEKLLCEAYISKGRNDLAECVRNARLHQRISDMFKCGYWPLLPDENLLGMLNGLADAIAPSDKDILPTTLQQWQQETMARHADDPDLPTVVELENNLKEIRPPRNAPC